MQILDLFAQPGFIVEACVVLFIIYKQVSSYLENKKRMDDYMDIFSHSDSWDVQRDDMGQVASIVGGASNQFFREIKDTINKYIAGNSNSVMEFQVFKDTVDRECDSIENQIESQTPIPLYLGLCGSMIGIIIGLIFLVVDGSFSQLLTGDKDSLLGIGSLLIAVAVAMFASLVGILLTVRITNVYKNSRSEAESRKNEFISWMQSTLFPALPNDISLAMTQLVSDLEDFNEKFENNTKSLAHTFDSVNEAYKTQADIVSAVQKMDVQSMATANIRVLEALQKSTEKIARFNDYLDSIHGYTDTIQKFNEQFHEDENQLGLLRQIRDFFKEELHEVDQRKQAIADAVSDVDLSLRNSFQQLTASSNEQVQQTKAQFEKQAEQFKFQLENQASQYNELLDKQKQAFSSAYEQMNRALSDKLNSLPESLSKLDEISKIPEELHSLASDIQNSMSQLTSGFSQTMSQMGTVFSQAIAKIPVYKNDNRASVKPTRPVFSKKEKIIGFTLIGITAVSAITSTVFCILMFLK